MKVALVTGEYWPRIGGGAGISATLLTRELRKRGIVVDVYVFDKPYPPSVAEMGTTRYYDVTDTRLWPLVNMRVACKLWKRLNKYDLVHLYNPLLMGGFGFLRSTSLSVPVVATLNGEEGACINYQRWMRLGSRSCDNVHTIRCALERAGRTEEVIVPGPLLAAYFISHRTLAQRLDRYIALSDIMKRLYVSHGFPKDRITVIGNMFDPSFETRLEQVREDRNTDNIIVLYVGRLSQEKGVDVLIKAFSNLNNARAELWIVGSGPEELKLKSLVSSFQRERKIKFLGQVRYDELAPVYKKAHIFVHPGRWPEAFNRTTLEAMLAGLAIIASDRGASPEVLAGAGLIYHDESELVRKMEMLIGDDRVRTQLGEAACFKARKDFSPDAVCHRIIAEYRDMRSAV